MSADPEQRGGYVNTLQSALHSSRSNAALGLSPMMVGAIIASFVSRPAIATLGRRLKRSRGVCAG